MVSGSIVMDLHSECQRHLRCDSIEVLSHSTVRLISMLSGIGMTCLQRRVGISAAL